MISVRFHPNSFRPRPLPTQHGAVSGKMEARACPSPGPWHLPPRQRSSPAGSRFGEAEARPERCASTAQAERGARKAGSRLPQRRSRSKPSHTPCQCRKPATSRYRKRLEIIISGCLSQSFQRQCSHFREQPEVGRGNSERNQTGARFWGRVACAHVQPACRQRRMRLWVSSGFQHPALAVAPSGHRCDEWAKATGPIAGSVFLPQATREPMASALRRSTNVRGPV